MVEVYNNVFSEYMIFKYITFGILGMFLSGCSLFLNSPLQDEKKVTIHQSGILQKSSESLLDYNSFVLINNGEIISSVSSQTISLSDFIDKKVMISGEILEPEDTNIQEKIMHLNVIQLSEISNYIPNRKQFPALGVSFPLSENYAIEEKKDRVLVLKGTEKENFFIVFPVKDPATIRTFLKDGEKISLGKYEVLRLENGTNNIEIFFPESQIEVNFKGEEKDIYDFYSVLEQFEFSDIQETKKNNENNENKIIHDTENLNGNSVKISDEKKLVEYIYGNTTEILKTENISPQIQKIGLYDDGIVDIEYLLGLRKMRSVFTTKKNNRGWDFSLLAKYEEGKIMSWDRIYGEIPVFTGTAKIFLGSVEDKNPVVLPENFALYVSTHFNFQIGYPRNLYFTAQGKSKKNLAQVSWDITPNTPQDPLFLLEILDGALEKKRELLTENAIEFPRTETTHFRLSSSDVDQWKVLNQMFETIIIAQ